MSIPVQSSRPTWEPLTPRGVGAFASASFGRLLLSQFVVACLVAAAVVWFLEKQWFPMARAAIQELPASGKISDGQLEWQGITPVQLSENRFLGFAVDLYHSGRLGREAHLQVEFGKDDVRIYSLLGYKVIDYTPGFNIPFNRTELGPWWGAWEPEILAGVAACILIGLMLAWTVLATLYFIPVRVISFFENRDLNLSQSWRLGAASMLPGAVFLTAGFVSYGLNWIDLIQLATVWVLHFFIGWIYLWVAPLFCPKKSMVKAQNPNPFTEPKKYRDEHSES